MKYYIEYPEDIDTKYETIVYPAGELQVRLTQEAIAKVTAAEEIRVIAKVKDGNFTELSLLFSALNGLRQSGQRFVLVLPYLPYARADRRFVEGDCNGIIAMSRIINTFDADSVVTIDVHSKQSFSVNRLINIQPDKFIENAVNVTQYIESSRDIAILLPDEGATRYDVKQFGLPVYQCTKVREPKTGKLLEFKVPEIKEKNVLIVDDICDGGGTFIGIADKIKGKNLYLYVTHGIFSKGFTELKKRFKKVFCTDTFNVPKPEDAGVIPTFWLIDKRLEEIQNAAYSTYQIG